MKPLKPVIKKPLYDIKKQITYYTFTHHKLCTKWRIFCILFCIGHQVSQKCHYGSSYYKCKKKNFFSHPLFMTDNIGCVNGQIYYFKTCICSVNTYLWSQHDSICPNPVSVENTTVHIYNIYLIKHPGFNSSARDPSMSENVFPFDSSGWN